ncbi:hypothetical protein Tco_0523909 [Tanacetum coccineum]
MGSLVSEGQCYVTTAYEMRIMRDRDVGFEKKYISCKSVIAKLVLSASTYYVWKERNARLFTNKKQSAPQVIEAIVSSIRLKLLSCSFKKTKDGIKAEHLWKLPGTSLIEL